MHNYIIIAAQKIPAGGKISFFGNVTLHLTSVQRPALCVTLAQVLPVHRPALRVTEHLVEIVQYSLVAEKGP